jgi:hypothetical protein
VGLLSSDAQGQEELTLNTVSSRKEVGRGKQRPYPGVPGRPRKTLFFILALIEPQSLSAK